MQEMLIMHGDLTKEEKAQRDAEMVKGYEGTGLSTYYWIHEKLKQLESVKKSREEIRKAKAWTSKKPEQSLSI